MSLLSNSNAISSEYAINNSLRFRGSATPYMSRTFVTPTSLQKWAWSGWVKLGIYTGAEMALQSLTTGTGPSGNLKIGSLALQPISNGYQLYFTYYQQAAAQYYFQTNAILRDPASWYHFFVCVDTTQATSTNIFNVYINGVRQTSFAVYAPPPQNYSSLCWNTANTHYIGNYFGNGVLSYQLDGYLAEIQYFDGQTIYTDTAGTLSTTFNVNKFGQTDPATGSWIPVAPSFTTATYGNNGYYLKFSNPLLTSNFNIGLGQDYSGKGNYWNNVQGISVTAGTTYDSMTDVPTLSSPITANYCTANPLDASPSGTSVISNANLTVNVSGSSAGGGFGGQARVNTINFTNVSGKWYWEAFVDNAGTGAATLRLTFFMSAEPINISGQGGPFTWSWRADGVNSGLTSAGTFATNDVVMFAYDSDTGKLWLGKNGTWTNSGVPASGTGNNATLTALNAYALGLNYGTSGGGTGTASFNFGQRPFSYTPPTGFNRLNTFNLPTPTILKGNTVMDATLYTGTGSSLSVTNTAGFKPDLLWIKDRSRIAFHDITDSVRGVNLVLSSNSTDAEATGSYVTSYNSNGFTLPANTTANPYYTNVSGDSFVGWQWQAGQGSTSSNTSGTITSTVSVNASAGFSVVTFNSGTAGNKTVGHGLGVKPAMLILKNRDSGLTASNWQVWHQSLSNQAQSYIQLNLTGAAATDSRIWANTAPTSTVFSFESAYTFLASNNIVAYCWAEIAGFSKFGSYTGNGSTDGPFVYLGFRPKWIMWKNTSNGTADAAWIIIDSARSDYNQAILYLVPNTSGAEASSTGVAVDFTSNGFKIRNTSTAMNANTNTIIYAAFAESPFRNSLAR